MTPCGTESASRSRLRPCATHLRSTALLTTTTAGSVRSLGGKQMTTNASSFLNAPPYFHHIFPDDGRRRPFRFAQTGSGQTQGQLIDPHPYCTRPDGLLCPEQVRRSARISAQRSRTSRCLRWTLMMCHGRTRLLPLFRGLRVAPSTCRLHRCVSACVPGCVRACVLAGWLAAWLAG